MMPIIVILIGLILFLSSGYKLVLGKYYDDVDLKILFTIFGVGIALLLGGFIL